MRHNTGEPVVVSVGRRTATLSSDSEFWEIRYKNRELRKEYAATAHTLGRNVSPEYVRCHLERLEAAAVELDQAREMEVAR